jgi:hypothetical protein
MHCTNCLSFCYFRDEKAGYVHFMDMGQTGIFDNGEKTAY